MGLTDEMRAAVEAPPPSEIDLDELVAKGRAQRSRSHVRLGVAGFVAIALASYGAYSLTASPKPNHPGPRVSVGVSPPVSSTPYVNQVLRLREVLQTFPASLHVPDTVMVTFARTDSQDVNGYYYSSWTYDHVRYGIDITPNGVDPSDNSDACAPGHRGDPSLACDQVVDGSGSMVTLTDLTPPDRYLSVDYARDDGTFVWISAMGEGDADLPSVADVQAAAHTPGLAITG